MNDTLAVVGVVIAILLSGVALRLWQMRRERAAGAAPAAPDIRTIGPRKFRKMEPRTVTFARDRWLADLLLEAGIGQIKRLDGESDEALCWRMTRQAFESPALPELLGGQLMPVELDEAGWTPAIALEIGHWLAARTDPAERAEIWKLVTETMAPFFLRALASTKNSPSSSVPGASSLDLPGQIAALMGTANGR